MRGPTSRFSIASRPRTTFGHWRPSCRPRKAVLVKAAYVTTYDSSDVRAWSGLGYYISRCLELAGIAVERIGTACTPRPSAGAHVAASRPSSEDEGIRIDRHPRVAACVRGRGRAPARVPAVRRRLQPGTIPIAHLDSGRPIAFWADATFGAMLRFYPDFRVLSRRAIRDGLGPGYACARACRSRLLRLRVGRPERGRGSRRGPRKGRGRAVRRQHAHHTWPRRRRRASSAAARPTPAACCSSASIGSASAAIARSTSPAS